MNKAICDLRMTIDERSQDGQRSASIGNGKSSIPQNPPPAAGEADAPLGEPVASCSPGAPHLAPGKILEDEEIETLWEKHSTGGNRENGEGSGAHGVTRPSDSSHSTPQLSTLIIPALLLIGDLIGALICAAAVWWAWMML